MSEERTYTINEAAALSGMHRNTIRLRIKMGQLEASVHPGKFGEEYRISRAALDKAGLLAASGSLSEPLSEPLDGPPRAGSVLDAEPVELSDPPLPGPAWGRDGSRETAGTGVAAMGGVGELFERHEQAMFRLGYLQGEVERLKALADTAESLRADTAARETELRSLRTELEEKEREAAEAEALRQEAETLRAELEQTRDRLSEMETLRDDIEQLKAEAIRKRPWWQFWSE
jgi:excisionase family DNA binding protein